MDKFNGALICLAIILIVIVGVHVFEHNDSDDNKLCTDINFLSASTLKNGDSIQFELQDEQDTEIPYQNVTIKYEDGSGNVQTYKVSTDKSGKGNLKINGEGAGQYNVTVIYDGNDLYDGCSASQSVTVQDNAQSSIEIFNDTASTSIYNEHEVSSASSN